MQFHSSFGELEVLELRACQICAAGECEEHRTFLCPHCKLICSWDFGAADDRPELCNDCWGLTTLYQCWSHDDGRELTFSTEENCKSILALEEPGVKLELLYEVRAFTWEEAMTEHHKRQGWEPYVAICEEAKVNP